jgi:DNA-binding response OmpR family regulator
MVSILVADDDVMFRELVRQVLVRRGFHVRCASSGQEALEQALAAPPHLIVLDTTMPDLNGYEVLHRLKTSPALAEIPVVMLSGHTESRAAAVALARGAADYLTKPFVPPELVARINAILGR